jgi:thiol:disulfide interchange protein
MAAARPCGYPGWMRMRVLLSLAVALLAGTSQASSTGASKHTRVELLAEASSIRPGTPFTVALHLTMESEWHTYWKNPGDSGKPTEIRWTLPEGFTAGAIQWPYPDTIALPPLMSYGYDGDVALLVELTPPTSLKPGTKVVLAAKVTWLECQHSCVPGKTELDLTLPVSEAAPALEEGAKALFADARKRLHADGASWQPEMLAAGPTLALTFAAPSAIRAARFFPETSQRISNAAPQPLRRTPSGYSLELTRAEDGAMPETMAGVLRVETDSGTRAISLAASVRMASSLPSGSLVTAAVATPGARDGRGLLAALGLAFIGGLILNLMPCVLPVLSLKVIGFVRHASEEGGKPWRHGLAFTVGVLLSFLILASVLLALRAGGQEIGWGFQLQSPRFVAGLACLFFLIGLNLFGLFEVGLLFTRAGNLTTGKGGLGSSLFDGALATVVATPCTAPFMGSALGFALAQPTSVALLVFATLGLGMAVPYLVLSMSPALLRFVPKPGAWMESFKQLMGFFMMGTVVVLVWIFGRQTGSDAVAVLLAGLVVVSLGAWLYGRALLANARRGLKTAGALACGAAGVAFVLSYAVPVRGDAEGITWQAFSPEAVAAARAEGRPVFIDFTATWCLTCQVNDVVGLRPASVVEGFRQRGVVAFKADWTSYDENITAELARYGRGSVPLYVLYAPGAAEPHILPEGISLTPGVVLRTLDETLGKTASTAAPAPR